MKKKLLVGLSVMLLLLSITSCASTTGFSQAAVKKELKNDAWGSPKTHALLFSTDIRYNTFLQQNPKFGYKFYDTTTRDEYISFIVDIPLGSVAFLEPLPVGSELKLFSDTVLRTTAFSTERKTTFYGIADVDIVLNKPGLFYYDPDAKDKNNKSELKSLKILYKYFKGTNSDWEKVIAERIEELENAKK